jgi:hypothetical protein
LLLPHSPPAPPQDPFTLGIAASLYARSGNAARATELRAKLEFLGQIRYVPSAAVAWSYDAPGGEEPYFRLMNQAMADFVQVVRVRAPSELPGTESSALDCALSATFALRCGLLHLSSR